MKTNYCVDCKYFVENYSCFYKSTKGRNYISKNWDYKNISSCFSVRNHWGPLCEFYKRKWWKFWVSK